MKKASIVLVLAMLGAVAHGDYLVQLQATYGYSSDYANDPSGLTPMLLNAGDRALVQLYYVGANGVKEYNEAAPLNSTGGTTFTLLSTAGVYGDDVLVGGFLTAPNTQNGASEYAPFGQVLQSAYLGANVYARIFDVGAQSGNGFFFETGIFTLNDKLPPAAPDIRDLDNAGAGGFAGLQPNGDVYQVIPEPATIGLMGIAGLGMFLARRKTRR